MTTSPTSAVLSSVGSSGSSSPYPWLLADIGGTNARFGWVQHEAAEITELQTFPVADHAGVAEAAKAYLASLPAPCGAGRLQCAAFAVATPVSEEGEMAFTNSAWRFTRHGLQQALGLRHLQVFNDFEALAWSLPQLKATQLRAHGRLPPVAGPLAVVGPGTGLGVAAMVCGPHGWACVSSEGGHSTLAAADSFESDLLGVVRRELGHVSAETVLSGTGLPLLHRSLNQLHGEPPDAVTTAEIGERATRHGDPQALRTVEVFCSLLGSFAGNVALITGARGGLYIGGGIVPRWGDLFFESQFRARFEDKGSYRPYLQAIPTAVITDTLVALAGARAAMAQQQGGRLSSAS